MKEDRIIKKRKINKIITVILLACLILFFSTVFYLGAIPIIYVIIALIIFIIITFFTVRLNFRKKRKKRIIGYTISIILISIMTFCEVYLYNTLGFLMSFTGKDYTLKTYNVLVLNSSNYKGLEDIRNKKVGVRDISDSESIDSAKKKINKEVTVNYKEYNDIPSLVEAINNISVEAIILEDSELELLKDENPNEYNILRIIYKVEVKTSLKELKSLLNINNEPFNIFISGIDTYGNIKSTSRSDVNMVVTVNPKTEKIFITWVPRDYYVKINKSNYKDKLTHAGIYGVDSSIYAMEQLLDIDINYYFKVNFTSIEKVVDLLGGVTVENDQKFTSIDGYSYKKGTITLDGKHALSFVRERKNVIGGDMGRGKNQVKVLEALIKKAIQPSIVKKYNSLLNSLDGAFVTNMSKNTMMAFIRKEISSPRNWQIDSINLTGTDSSNYTYSYKNQKLYVMIPDENSVKEAKTKIKNIIKPKENK